MNAVKMMGKKILENESLLLQVIENLRGKKIVLCQGHFNVIHPGHLRFLEYAKEQGDYLIVAVQGENKLEPVGRRNFFSVEERAKNIASISLVDFVFIFNSISFEDLIKLIRPHIYIMGAEFKEKESSKIEKEIVQKYGGKVHFSAGSIHYSSTEVLEKDLLEINEERVNLFNSALKKQNIKSIDLEKLTDAFKTQKVLIIGDTIIDQYVACDPLGMSSEAPVLVLKELEAKKFLGGAAIIARHVKAMGATCHFMSLVGQDNESEFVYESLREEDISSDLFKDELRPTIFKIRYMVGTQKILRVSRLEERVIGEELENTFIKTFRKRVREFNAIIVSDFNYGFITQGILDEIVKASKEYNIKLFGDSQSSSQIGDVSKFKNFHLITPTEREARIALQDKYSGIEVLGRKLIDKTNSNGLILKLGENGFIVYERTSDEQFFKTQHFPALVANPVDVMGAGDALLASISLGYTAEENLMLASALSTIVASLATMKMGNIPVKINEIKKCLEQQRYHYE